MSASATDAFHEANRIREMLEDELSNTTEKTPQSRINELKRLISLKSRDLIREVLG